MKKVLLLFVILSNCFSTIFAQKQFGAANKPKLVVGIVVDQMRWDYLERYYDRFTVGGFKRILKGGFSCNNVFINYTPTVTACGHSCIYSGSVPAITGIAGNNFYIGNKKVYCTEDNSVSTVGSNTKVGKMSPRNMQVTTMCDALRLATDFRSRVIGVSLKDRGAILPAGHTANAAYWYDVKSGVFVTSTYYMEQLPNWLKTFNKENKQTHDIRYSSEGNTIVAKMAEAALKGEKLGNGDATDFLAVSFSSTDYIGHKYGTRAVQTDSAYLELDKDIADLLSSLDKEVGENNYLLFLSADHGASHNNLFLKEHNVPSGTIDEGKLLEDMNGFLREKYSCQHPLVKNFIENRVYLDKDAIGKSNLNYSDVKSKLVDFLENKEEIAYAVDYKTLKQTNLPAPISDRILMGYNAKRSGDIQIIPATGYYDVSGGSFAHGTTHGVWNPYDTHIPLIFYGWNVKQGQTSKEYTISDIAATICSMLNIQQPNGCIGKVVDRNAAEE